MSPAETSARIPGACTPHTTCWRDVWPGCASAHGTWLKALPSSRCTSAISWWAMVPTAGPSSCWPVRLIALVVPDEQAEALRRQKQRQARDKGRTLSPEAHFLAGFVLLLTTLPAQTWPTERLLELYRARWQIEVLFKRIKQVLAMHILPAQTPQGAQAMICALLVAWMLIPGSQLCYTVGNRRGSYEWISGIGSLTLFDDLDLVKQVIVRAFW
jgi:hypothetical protein